jgi:hypothetical protein
VDPTAVSVHMRPRRMVSARHLVAPKASKARPMIMVVRGSSNTGNTALKPCAQVDGGASMSAGFPPVVRAHLHHRRVDGEVNLVRDKVVASHLVLNPIVFISGSWAQIRSGGRR